MTPRESNEALSAARVLSAYYRTRAQLDSPIGFQITDPRATWHGAAVWEIPLATRRREALLLAVCAVGVALSRLSRLHRAVLQACYDPERGLTNRQLARALALDMAEARAVHIGALLALAGELAKLIALPGCRSLSDD